MRTGTLTIRDASEVVDRASGITVFHVNDPHALVQAAGYFKFVNASDNEESVYFRGQSRLHKGLEPTLFRGSTNPNTHGERQGKLRKAVTEIRKRCKIFDGFSQAAAEPLLQHYGLKTSWIDVVDNVWVALWFACHEAYISGSTRNYLHFQRRTARNRCDYAYVLLVSAPLRSCKRTDPGVVVGERAESVDLRIAVPSVFLRPHSQHGLLVRMRGTPVRRPNDYKPLVRATIRVRLGDALGWLGNGSMLDAHALFPPPYYDHGYAILLESGFIGNSLVGAVHHIGA